MKKEDFKKIQFDHYGLLLYKHLKETGDSRQEDIDFIIARADLAADECEQKRHEGLTVEGAEECAVRVLMNGL